MSSGKVLFLQGLSSSGKSTLAVELQKGLEEHWWVLEADDITRMQATSDRTGWWKPEPGERIHASWDPDQRLAQWLAGYFGCLATIARTGSNVIAVGGWLETAWLVDLAKALAGIDALCVGVYCPVEECERRELARGDREVGYARSQMDRVHRHAPYDLEVDTFSQSTAEILSAIKQLLASPPSERFFEKARWLT